MASIGSLVADLGLDTVRFENGIKKSQASIKRFSRNAERSFQKMNRSAGVFASRLGAIAVVGFGAMIKGALDTADAMEKMQRRLGISTESLSQMKFAAEQSGIALSTLTMAMQRAQRRIAEAANGMGEAKDALVELGLSAQQMNRLSPDKQLLAIADAMGGVADSGDKTRLAMKLFDSEGVSLLQMFEEGSAGIESMMKEADRLGLTLNNKTAKGAAAANDAINRAKSAMQGAALQSAENLIPAIEHLGNTFASSLPLAINGALKAFLVFQREAAGVLSFLTNRYATFHLVVADILERLGFATQAMAERADALTLANFSNSLLNVHNGADAAVNSMNALNHEVGEMAANPPTEPAAPFKKMSEGMLEAQAIAQKLGETMKVDIFDKSENLFGQLKNQWAQTLKDMVNAWVSSGIRNLFGSMFASGSSGGMLAGLGGLFGFANGGSFEVGGGGGTDSNLVAFKATRGETVTVNKAGESGGGGGGIVFQNSYDFSGSTLSESEVRQMIEQSQSITKRQIQNAMIRGRF